MVFNFLVENVNRQIVDELTFCTSREFKSRKICLNLIITVIFLFKKIFVCFSYVCVYKPKSAKACFSSVVNCLR